MAPQTPVISDAVNELFVVADQYQIVINPDSANGVVGEQLNARMRAGIGQVEMQIQSPTKQLKAKDEIITTMCAEKERAAHKRTHAVYEDDDDEDEDYWADKERAARKRKLGEVDDDDGHDEDEEDEERELGGGGDENLIAIYEATKALIREFPRCTGKTPIGKAFDNIRRMINNKPITFDEDADLAFLLQIDEAARGLVTKFPFDGRDGLAGAFRRIRRLFGDY